MSILRKLSITAFVASIAWAVVGALETHGDYSQIVSCRMALWAIFFVLLEQTPKQR